MSAVTVAKKDFRDAVRAKSLWALSALFILLIGGIAWGFAEFIASGDSTTLDLLLILRSPVSLFIPITALLIGHKAIAGERDSGSLKLLLSLPHTRRDVLLGKIVGRTGVLTLPLLIGFAVAAVINVAMYEGFDPVQFVLFTLLTVGFGFVFITVAVGLSAATGSASLATWGAIGFWLFDQVWSTLLTVLLIVFGSGVGSGSTPTWFQVLSGINPSSAFGNAAALFLPSDVSQQLQSQLGNIPTTYGLVVLAAWVVLGLGVGLATFERGDL